MYIVKHDRKGKLCLEYGKSKPIGGSGIILEGAKASTITYERTLWDNYLAITNGMTPDSHLKCLI